MPFASGAAPWLRAGLFTRPYPPHHPLAEDPLVGSIAQQLITDREGHDQTAVEWTKRYAK